MVTVTEISKLTRYSIRSRLVSDLQPFFKNTEKSSCKGWTWTLDLPTHPSRSSRSSYRFLIGIFKNRQDPIILERNNPVNLKLRGLSGVLTREVIFLHYLQTLTGRGRVGILQ